MEARRRARALRRTRQQKRRVWAGAPLPPRCAHWTHPAGGGGPRRASHGPPLLAVLLPTLLLSCCAWPFFFACMLFSLPAWLPLPLAAVGTLACSVLCAPLAERASGNDQLTAVASRNSLWQHAFAAHVWSSSLAPRVVWLDPLPPPPQPPPPPSLAQLASMQASSVEESSQPRCWSGGEPAHTPASRAAPGRWATSATPLHASKKTKHKQTGWPTQNAAGAAPPPQGR